MDFYILLGLTAALLGLSFFKDRRKTLKALKIAGKRGRNIALPLLLVILGTAAVFHFFPQERIAALMEGGSLVSLLLGASAAGMITLMPGFIAFPLGGLLRQNGVPYMVIAAFTSTLMMVGIVTLPVEKKYLGLKVALLRNLIALVIALSVALATGLVYKEILL